ncbi:DUF2332 domain-containing protein [Frankia gtarii]|uniref:DUF2332 domain-containing protein n=1 Tax=Frankia gtarii TaxID=2950102 RepID=UPI0021BDF661|nr:DUF2332 domain-containing protein [Frankia gtarii]
MTPTKVVIPAAATTRHRRRLTSLPRLDSHLKGVDLVFSLGRHQPDHTGVLTCLWTARTIPFVSDTGSTVSVEVHEIMVGFANFSKVEGMGSSPLYESLASSVGGDPELASVMLDAPLEQRRHTLYFAALHFLVLQNPDHPLAQWFPTVSPTPRQDSPEAEFRRFCRTFESEIRVLVAGQRTQTNEVGRCAVLHPALSWAFRRERAPISLVDVGCSAGLNLFPDRWRYDYSNGVGLGDQASPVRVACQLRSSEPLPSDPFPAVVRRIGVDLNPVDIRDDTQTRWLQACVFADQPERFSRLGSALAAVRRDPARIHRGDLLSVVPDLLAGWTGSGPICLTSTWTLAYLDRAQREQFRETLERFGRSLDLHLIMGEPPNVEWVDTPPGMPDEATVWTHVRFGPGNVRTTFLGYSQPHGAWLSWKPQVDVVTA